ncbi:DUF3862 domain-containing protein [Anaerotalea alkaliphila]|uniref:Beta-barrel assembly machine subunit BamE n=1 Tax=Anaerotalea alkaliphila TaxID=2662126 RepID=A0A7X5HXL0_9FIRM|nr:DUF3862 domain-containing protein [Anaerotalea alkaliphila]NDL68466.1 hypothetical protein [Anaerotalea alkaliphila]
MKNRQILLVLLCLVLAGCSPSGDKQVGNGNAEPEAVASDSRMYNMEKYARINPGQSYGEVETIMGNPGEAMVDNDRLKQYQWTNEDGSMVSVTFYDDAMTGKGQAHLGPLLKGEKAVTAAMFDKIGEGMEMQEVVDILGPGTERMLVVVDGREEVMMGWDNDDGGGISVTLLDGKVIKKTDSMLK